jgi:hypothetical protein
VSEPLEQQLDILQSSVQDPLAARVKEHVRERSQRLERESIDDVDFTAARDLNQAEPLAALG